MLELELTFKTPEFNASLAAHQLCDLEKVIQPAWSSVCFSVE